MFPFKRKSKLDKLKREYQRRMRDSFMLALKDRNKSLSAQREALKIQEQINMLKGAK